MVGQTTVLAHLTQEVGRRLPMVMMLFFSLARFHLLLFLNNVREYYHSDGRSVSVDNYHSDGRSVSVDTTKEVSKFNLFWAKIIVKTQSSYQTKNENVSFTVHVYSNCYISREA